MQSKRASLDRLLNPKYEVNCHYLIDRKGNVTKIIDETFERKRFYRNKKVGYTKPR